MQTKKLVNRYGAEVELKLADDIKVVASGTGFDLERADGTLDTVRFDEIDTTTANPKATITVNGTVVKTIQLNRNDVQIDASASDYDLTDDIVQFVDTKGTVKGTINFSKYLITATENSDGNIEISQDGNLLATISQNASGIDFDNTGSNLASDDVEAAIKEVNQKITDGAGQKGQDFVSTAGQTTFTLSFAPVGQVKMERNGIGLANASHSVAGAVVTYNPAQNGASALVAGERISFIYEG